MNDHSASYFVGDEYLESQSEKIMKIADIKLQVSIIYKIVWSQSQ